MQYFTSSDAAVAALRSGELDSIDDLTPTQYEALDGSIRTSRCTRPESNIWNAIELNPARADPQTGRSSATATRRWPIPVVRQAIALAINRNELVSKVAGRARRSPGPGYLTAFLAAVVVDAARQRAGGLRPGAGEPTC